MPSFALSECEGVESVAGLVEVVGTLASASICAGLTILAKLFADVICAAGALAAPSEAFDEKSSFLKSNVMSASETGESIVAATPECATSAATAD